ncbi:MAG: 50S ribosomal protein L15 [Candidatus Omnitrophica bacterium]|nr:50S ribosomal protein L15 [Candidatus Omnitrophota bacterium]
MQLHQLVSPKGSRKSKRIIGRGPGSGRGKTSGRGQDGQGSRSGERIMRSLEGGQNPIIKRIPKVGFRCPRPVLNQVVNVDDLNRFKSGDVVDAQSLKKISLIASLNRPVKILGTGEVTKKLTVQGVSISKSAKEKIEKAGGTVTLKEKKSEERKKPSERNKPVGKKEK